jgi:hypothetical protein
MCSSLHTSLLGGSDNLPYYSELGGDILLALLCSIAATSLP